MLTRSLAACAITVAGFIGSGLSAQAQDAREAEILGFHQLCDHGDRRACVRFGMLISRMPTVRRLGAAPIPNGSGGSAEALLAHSGFVSVRDLAFRVGIRRRGPLPGIVEQDPLELVEFGLQPLEALGAEAAGDLRIACFRGRRVHRDQLVSGSRNTDDAAPQIGFVGPPVDQAPLAEIAQDT